MSIHALYIINKAGGLIYQKDWGQSATTLSSNEYLRLAGVFHGMHTIARTIAPTKQSSGIVTLEGENMQLRCFQTVTGTKFFVIAGTQQGDLERFLSDVYTLYTDYCLKNPFYELEQPIHNNCERFVYQLDVLVGGING